MQLDFDGETQDASVMMLSLGNGAREGGGFKVTPEARLDDGLLDTATVRQLNRLQMLMLLPRVMNGTHITSPHVKMNRVKTLRVKMNHALPIHIDGEIFSDERSRELTIETLAGQLRVITLH
jgi:diacylglycerol kinase (ATP)